MALMLKHENRKTNIIRINFRIGSVELEHYSDEWNMLPIFIKSIRSEYLDFITRTVIYIIFKNLSYARGIMQNGNCIF